ncbi:DUF4124 domain-containing protein [Azonexus sp. IMCC34839]|uniref:DUF4124 domain-containing protein n=1 Tax=Azonexus sp. IMCC34839 TaxID=3133695 RepID=UPI00399B75BF
MKPLFALLLTALCTSTALADVYKCRNADGSVEISNSPCAGGASTLKSRPDEKVSEADRQRAEKDVEKMRDYVDKREAVQRSEAAAEREAAARQAKNAQSQPSPRIYGSADECLRDVAQMGLEANQRSQMEADCRRIGSSSGVSGPYPVYTTPYGYPPRHYHPPVQTHPQPKPKPEPPAPTVAFPPIKK